MTSPSLNQEDWAPPEKIRGISLKEWPKDVFPSPYEEFIHELARSTETPVDLSAFMVLSVIATAAQKTYEIQIKSDYREPINIWVAVALASGSRKSAVQSACIRPLVGFESDLKKQVIPLKEEIEARNKTIEARIKEMRLKAGKASEDDFERLSREIISLEKLLKVSPSIPQLWTSDITPENLASLMQENFECMSILSDEAGIFDILAGRYTGGIPNLDLFLKAHAGTSCRVNRSGRPPIFLDSPLLTLGLSPQPSHLKGLSENKMFRGRGLIARFMYSLPSSNIGSRTFNELPINQIVQKNYHEAILKLLTKTRSIESRGCYQLLQISDEALALWGDYSRYIEVLMGDDGPFASFRDWAGKLPGAIARLSALIHIMRDVTQAGEENLVQKNEMFAAIKIGRYLQDHALAVFDLFRSNESLESVGAVLSWIVRNRRAEFSRRDCYRALRSCFSKVSEIDPVLELLEETGHIRLKAIEPVPHRRSILYEVNPLILKQSL